MKNKDLIEKLKSLDPDLEVRIETYEGKSQRVEAEDIVRYDRTLGRQGAVPCILIKTLPD